MDGAESLYLVLLQTLGALVLFAAVVYVLCKIADALFAAVCWCFDTITLDRAAREMGRWADATVQTWDEPADGLEKAA